MEKIIVVKSGEGYGDAMYTFENDNDAIALFKLLSKATRVGRDYVSGKGYLYTQSRSTQTASLESGDFCTVTELEEIKAEELLQMEKEQAEREAREQAEKAPKA